MNIQEHLMFFNVCYTLNLNNINNFELIKEIEIFKKKYPNSLKISNYGGWQSKDVNKKFILKENFLNIKNLCEQVEMCSESISKIWDINCLNTIENFWININKYKDFNTSHLHPGSIFSAVYYVLSDENSGKIIFERPDIQESYIKSNMNNKYTYGSFFIKPTNGLLVFFPSYLKHFVEPSLSKQDRISIAFNII
jgi:uncharacterized protein (TIGR02466 family)